MAFKSLNHVLGSLDDQEAWQERRQFRHLLDCWQDVVGAIVAVQAQPQSVHRRVLKVATSSSVWAHNLTFERQRILDKINPRLQIALTDIRFSTAQWQNHTPQAIVEPPSTLWQEHPSHVVWSKFNPEPIGVTKGNAKGAFRQWAQVIQQRSRHLPLCARCQCPTPQGELERWTMCALCAAKTWHL